MMITEINKILGDEGLQSVDFDITLDDELYVRTRIERRGNGGKAYYFVRSGDTAERGEGSCPAEAFSRIGGELAEQLATEGDPSAIGHRLCLNDKSTLSTLTAAQLRAVAESLACHVDELSLLDNFKPYL